MRDDLEFLGEFWDGTWAQHVDEVGQHWYQNLSCETPTYQLRIPDGYTDIDTDIWNPDFTRRWPQWRNARTGRVQLDNPYPENYLDRPNMGFHMQEIERDPQCSISIYKRCMLCLLGFFFRGVGPFSVTEEYPRGPYAEDPDIGDWLLPKIIYYSPYDEVEDRRDFCLGECRKAGDDWDAAKERLGLHCANAESLSKRVWAFASVGLDIQFFRAEQGTLTPQTDRLNLRADVKKITRWCEIMEGGILWTARDADVEPPSFWNS